MCQKKVQMCVVAFFKVVVYFFYFCRKSLRTPLEATALQVYPNPQAICYSYKDEDLGCQMSSFRGLVEVERCRNPRLRQSKKAFILRLS